ncbi:MAG TPA: DUF1003 domain-containing protein [Longimicrobiaceae bacterium]|nr:DUF1003 domain-containing protein [Longimicrobiaceae bacterium]
MDGNEGEPPVDPGVPDRRARRVLADRHMEAVKARYVAGRTRMERTADTLIRIASSTPFLALHVAWFAVWIAWNVGAFGLVPFDPFPFGLLTMVVSLEAIFLSIFVLITQNRESAIAELREEVTLAVELSVEAETTKILQLLLGLYSRMGFAIGEEEELRRLLEPLDKERIERELSEQIQQAGKRPGAHRPPPGE